MAIRKKVDKEKEASMETIRQEVISRGGHVVADLEEEKVKKDWMNFCLRIKVEMLDQIDRVLEERVGISKTGWILEAIHEKLKKIEMVPDDPIGKR